MTYSPECSCGLESAGCLYPRCPQGEWKTCMACGGIGQGVSEHENCIVCQGSGVVRADAELTADRRRRP